MYATVILVGRLGREPELRYMPDGTPVTSFSVATDHTFNDRNGQKVKTTTWFRISVFGKQAESANTYLQKGKLVLVEGRLKPDLKTGGPQVFTRQDGTMGAAFEVVANTVRFLSPKGEGAEGGGEGGGEGGAESNGNSEAASDSGPVSEDNIPF